MSETSSLLPIADLWHSADPEAWAAVLEHYWDLVKAPNRKLEEALDPLDLDRLRRMDATAWYHFLRDEYFRWKYTAPNRYGSTTKLLREFADEHNPVIARSYQCWSVTPGLADDNVRVWQCAPKARITSGGGIHPESCRLIW
jgi:hypothetical protein